MDSSIVTLIAEQNGIADLSELVSSDISTFVSNLLRFVITMAKNFKDKSRRRVLMSEDVESSIAFHGLTCQFGYQMCSNLQFKYAGSMGRDFFIREDPDIDLNTLINSPLPKLPLEPFIKSHWLVIDGVQPLVPENPHSPTSAQSQQNQDGIQSIVAQSTTVAFGDNAINDRSTNAPMLLNQMAKNVRKTEQVQIKTTTTHALSLEQQIFFKEVTEAIMGNDENRRLEALNCLMTDCGLQVLLPRLSLTIAEGVRCNIAQHNLAILIYLMRMIQSLLQNESVSLERCLHEFLPAIMSCILSRQLCAHVQSDNHWALREFSSRLLAIIAKKYEHPVLRSRITKALSRAFHDPNCSFATLYGAVFALNQLGADTTRSVVAPRYNIIMDAIKRAENDSAIPPPEKKAALKLRLEMAHVS